MLSEPTPYELAKPIFEKLEEYHERKNHNPLWLNLLSVAVSALVKSADPEMYLLYKGPSWAAREALEKINKELLTDEI